jgi:hypothetical protein
VWNSFENLEGCTMDEKLKKLGFKGYIIDEKMYDG